METLALPSFKYKIQRANNTDYILDLVRKKYIRLTPEEWVRQHFVNYLITDLAYPKSLIRLEKTLQHNNNYHRPDIIMYNQTIQPIMLVECKAPTIPIIPEALTQISHYNRYIQAKILVVTNGMQHFCWEMKVQTEHYVHLSKIPYYRDIATGLNRFSPLLGNDTSRSIRPYIKKDIVATPPARIDEKGSNDSRVESAE